MTAEPTYLLDFRNNRVLELDPSAEADAEDATKGPGPEAQRELTFASLGSPVEHQG